MAYCLGTSSIKDNQMSHSAMLDFYRQQSCFSSPDTHQRLFDSLPDTISELCQIVRGIYVHYRSSQISPSMEERLDDVNSRYCSTMLTKLLEMDNRNLLHAREIEQRVIGCCRDASLLLCTVLRHQGIPARMRVGFATYIKTDSQFPYTDHVVTEYWDANQERWKMVDAEQGTSNIQANDIEFDVHDIPHDKFLTAGKAWQIGRADQQRWDDFGVNNDIKGRWFVASYLMYDLAALNRWEMLLWDSWGLMKDLGNLSQADLALLDQIAELSQPNTQDFDQIQKIYQSYECLTVPKTIMMYSPVSPWREVRLACE